MNEELDTTAINPKEAFAAKSKKSPMEYLVFSILEQDAKCHKHGADKYGKLNWRNTNIKASVYVGAIMRHFMAWEGGEDLDPDSGLSHLAHIRACCAVILDSTDHGTFVDDRGEIGVISPDAQENEP